jgi:hypothetical protein
VKKHEKHEKTGKTKCARKNVLSEAGKLQNKFQK